jgi:hypothetical protein
MKITIPVELDLAMEIQITAEDLDVDEATVQEVLASAEFRTHLAQFYAGIEDVYAMIDEYVAATLDQ